MSILKPQQGVKPLDVGGAGVTASVDAEGRIIVISGYHPQHGIVQATSAEPFPESERYHPPAVRAYRAGLAQIPGFGLHFDEPVTTHEAELIADAIPRIRLRFAGGGQAEVTTFATGGGIVQSWAFEGATPRWDGPISLQRAAYTQLTEGGPLPPVPLDLHARLRGRTLGVENRALPWSFAVAGFPSGAAWEQVDSRPFQVAVAFESPASPLWLAYAFGPTLDAAEDGARALLQSVGDESLAATIAGWREAFVSVPSDRLVRRALAYGMAVAVPVDDTLCLLTDHVLLPLSWNRDAYYAARALLSWRASSADLVRRHVLWMFERAELVDGFWGRSYLANGQVKDRAFQLDQQLFPLLELAEYVLETGDRPTLDRLGSAVQVLRSRLLARKAAGACLFPTDETPADDPIALPYHLSSHILFWRAATLMARVGMEGNWASLAADLRAAVQQHFVGSDPRIYAYATDGQGHFHFYHDANDFPLVLAPVWGFVPADDPIWQATIDFSFSAANANGVYTGRLGSVHTRAPWALGDIQELIAARALGDDERERRARRHLESAAQWDGALPEAYNAETGVVGSRHWFEWPNAAYACLILGAFNRQQVHSG